MEWVETTGDSVTEAKAAAVDLLGIAGDEAEFEIINEERKNFLGRVKDQARIRARVRPTAPRPKQERSDRGRNRNKGGGGRSKGNGNSNKGGEGRSKGNGNSNKGDGGRARSGESRGVGNGARSSKPAGSRSPRDDRPARADAMSLQRQSEVISEFLGGMLRAFKLEGRIEGSEIEDSTLEVNVVGPELGLLVGPRGNTLRAVQELARTVVQRQSGGNAEGRVRIDIAGYRERRKVALTAFTSEVATTVIDTGREQALEPMSAADRKIVHDAVSDLAGVDTISEGSEPERRVVIIPAD